MYGEPAYIAHHLQGDPPELILHVYDIPKTRCSGGQFRRRGHQVGAPASARSGLTKPRADNPDQPPGEDRHPSDDKRQRERRHDLAEPGACSLAAHLKLRCEQGKLGKEHEEENVEPWPHAANVARSRRLSEPHWTLPSRLVPIVDPLTRQSPRRRVCIRDASGIGAELRKRGAK